MLHNGRKLEARNAICFLKGQSHKIFLMRLFSLKRFFCSHWRCSGVISNLIIFIRVFHIQNLLPGVLDSRDWTRNTWVSKHFQTQNMCICLLIITITPVFCMPFALHKGRSKGSKDVRISKRPPADYLLVKIHSLPPSVLDIWDFFTIFVHFKSWLLPLTL